MSGIEAQLEGIHDRLWIYLEDGTIVYETTIAKEYPDIDIHRLCDFLDDTLFDWTAAKLEYLKWHGGKAL